MTDSSKPETPAASPARRALGFAIVALIPAVISWIVFFLASPSPNPTFDQIPLAIIIGFCFFTLLLLLATIQIYRIRSEKLIPLSERIAGIVSNHWIAIPVVLLLLEINLLAFPLLYNVAPSITNPAKFLLVWWSLLLA